jgi:hypothetical protein
MENYTINREKVEASHKRYENANILLNQLMTRKTVLWRDCTRFTTRNMFTRQGNRAHFIFVTRFAQSCIISGRIFGSICRNLRVRHPRNRDILIFVNRRATVSTFGQFRGTSFTTKQVFAWHKHNGHFATVTHFAQLVFIDVRRVSVAVLIIRVSRFNRQTCGIMA